MNLQNLEGMLQRGRDTPLLRFGLGKAYLDVSDSERAVEHLRRCVELDPDYTAAWKILGGVLVAKRKGDRQAEKEMGVFIRRVDKQST